MLPLLAHLSAFGNSFFVINGPAAAPTAPSLSAVMPVLDTGIHAAGLATGWSSGGMDPVIKSRGDGKRMG